MSTSAKSPILQFLLSKENLPAVLDVIHYADEIRDEVARRFWEQIEIALKKHQPAGFKDNACWKPDWCRTDEGLFFDLEVRFGFSGDQAQGLTYEFETHTNYFGFGLAWLSETKNFKDLCQRKSVSDLRAALKKRLPGDIDPEPNRKWLWFEYWERDPYTDPGSWFAQDFNEKYYEDIAQKFWGFVEPMHPLVAAANEALRRD